MARELKGKYVRNASTSREPRKTPTSSTPTLPATPLSLLLSSQSTTPPTKHTTSLHPTTHLTGTPAPFEAAIISTSMVQLGLHSAPPRWLSRLGRQCLVILERSRSSMSFSMCTSLYVLVITKL